jgi:hypothetical protein
MELVAAQLAAISNDALSQKAMATLMPDQPAFPA